MAYLPIERRLYAFFRTVRIKSKHKQQLRIESDGCAGNGWQHWRGVYLGDELVAALTSDRSRIVCVTLADKHGNLRGQKPHEFRSMIAAVNFLKSEF
jgi:hypothetical protein